MSDYKGMGQWITQTGEGYTPPDIDQFDDIELDDESIEEKSIIRRVRTLAGVRKYNQPIGSIIVPDVVPNVDFSRPHVANNHPIGRKLKSKFHEIPDEFTHMSLDVQQHLSPRRDVYQTSGYRVVIDKWPNAPVAKCRVRLLTVNGRLLADDSLPQIPDPVWIREAIEALRDPDNVHYVERKSHKPLFAEHSKGVRGLDWVYEGDEQIALNDVLGRTDSAQSEAANLGLNVDDEGWGTPGYLAQEMVNTTYRQYLDWWPNWDELLDTVALTHEAVEVDPQENGAFGTDPHNYIAFIEHKPLGKDVLKLNTDYWESDNAAVSLLDDQLGGREDGFKNVDIKRLAKEMKIDITQAAMLSTLNHEFGHVIASTIFYERGGMGLPIYKYRQEVIDEFRQAFMDLAAEYGADVRYPQQLWDLALAHVSRYGGENIQEFLAEVWCSYVLDVTPTEFVARLGTLMDFYFTKVMQMRTDWNRPPVAVAHEEG